MRIKEVLLLNICSSVTCSPRRVGGTNVTFEPFQWVFVSLSPHHPTGPVFRRVSRLVINAAYHQGATFDTPIRSESILFIVPPIPSA